MYSCSKSVRTSLSTLLCFVVSTLIGGAIPAWAAKPVTGWVARSTGAQSVALIEGERPGTWIDLNSGKILKQCPTTDAKRTSNGGRLLWAKTRLAEDQDGGTHIFLEQRYMPNHRMTASGLRVPLDGFPLRGSSIGFHYDKNGHLFGVAGTRFEDIRAVIKPSIVTARGALENAATGARFLRGDVAYLEGLNESFLKNLLREAKVLLASTGDGKTYGYLWALEIPTNSGLTINVTLDAATGELLSLFDGKAQSTCAPDSNSQVLVDGRSQQDNLIYDLPATEADLGGIWSEFTREAHQASGPEIVVHLGEDGYDDQCPSTAGDQYYRVLPLKPNETGNTWYEDRDVAWRDFPIPGRSAADAMRHTIDTMAVFEELGWESYDDQGSTANILVDFSRSENAHFNDSSVAPAAPRGVVIGRDNFLGDRQMSASLDIVAHEWGHGVLHYSSEVPYENTGAQLHEGFADFVGHFVEEGIRNSTNWANGEDIGDPYRPCSTFDNTLSYHRCDPVSFAANRNANPPPDDAGAPHAAGHKLTVAFYLAVAGGPNPGRSACDANICFNMGEDVPADICDLADGEPELPILDIDHARRFFFTLMTLYASSTTDWVDLPRLATLVGRPYHSPDKVLIKRLISVDNSDFPQCVEYHDYEGAVAAHAALAAIGFLPNHQLREQCE